MVNQEKVGGVDSYLLFGEETTFGTAASSITSTLGLIQNFNPTINRSVQEHRGFVGSNGGGQGVEKFTLGSFAGTFSVDFNPFDFQFLEYIIGARTGTGTLADPFIYTEANSLTPLTFSSNIDNDTTDRETQYLGTKFENLTIRAEVGGPVTVSASAIYADIDKDSTLTSNQNLPTNEIVNFTGASLEVPDTTTISNIIDSVEVVFTRNPEMLVGLNSDIPQNAVNKAREYRINFTVKYLDEAFIEQTLGSTSGLSTISETTLTLKLDNGTNRTIDIQFTGVVFPEYNNPQTVTEVMTEGMTCFARSVSATEQVSA